MRPLLTMSEDRLDYVIRPLYGLRRVELLRELEAQRAESSTYEIPREPVSEVTRRYMVQGLEDQRTVSLTCLTCGGRWPHHAETCDPDAKYREFQRLLEAAERWKQKYETLKAQRAEPTREPGETDAIDYTHCGMVPGKTVKVQAQVDAATIRRQVIDDVAKALERVEVEFHGLGDRAKSDDLRIRASALHDFRVLALEALRDPPPAAREAGR